MADSRYTYNLVYYPCAVARVRLPLGLPAGGVRELEGRVTKDMPGTVITAPKLKASRGLYFSNLVQCIVGDGVMCLRTWMMMVIVLVMMM